MGSKKTASLGLFLVLNLLFFITFTSACLDGKCNRKSWQKREPEPKPWPKPNPNPTPTGRCPEHALKLGACVDILHGLVNTTVGMPPVQPCCSLIRGLIDIEVALCLCTKIDVHLLHIINLNIPLSLSLILNNCGKKIPEDFKCPL